MVLPQGRQSVQIRIFNMIHYRAVGEVAALCVIVIVLAALPVVLFAILGRRKVDVLGAWPSPSRTCGSPSAEVACWKA
jgi:ABC-type Fe3+ transport system permease subunit